MLRETFMSSEAKRVEGAEEVLHAFLTFLSSYSSDTLQIWTDANSSSSICRDYVQQLKALRDSDGTTLYVNFQHLVR